MARLEQEFHFRGFRVAVPQSILKGWAAVPVDEVCKIMDSVLLVYVMQNHRWKGARVQPAVVATELNTGEQMIKGLQILREGSNLPVPSAKKLTSAEVKDRVLLLLQFKDYRAWNRSPIAAVFPSVVKLAALEGDQRFFKALGDRLKKKPIPFKAPRKFSPLAELLLEHWITRKEICFCWFSNKALTEFLKKTDETYSADAIRKAYERLRLRKLNPPLVRSIEAEGKRIRLRP